jgi:outer membrane protein OmpA-like peptidoglycan-associated protein
LDTTPPSVTLQAEYSRFSPNGDGERDTVTFEQESSSEDIWTGEIVNRDGEVVFSRSWEGEAETWTWDGRTDDGDIAVDGVYTYRLRATDPAGNQRIARIDPLEVDTLSETMNLAFARDRLSPNNDGFEDDVNVSISVARTTGVVSWSLAFVEAETDRARRTITGLDSVPETVRWNGRTDDDTVVDGTYFARFSIEYDNGAASRVRTDDTVLLDGTGPEISLSVSPQTFEPDGDGERDTLRIEVGIEDETSRVDSWVGEIVDPMGSVFRSLEGEGSVDGVFEWDGRSEDGELVQSAMTYTVRVRAADELDNSTSAESEFTTDILVEELPDGRRRIVIPSIIFEPNQWDLFADEDEQLRSNLDTLRRLAGILDQFGDADILVEGHAAHVYYEDPELMRTEQRTALIPLSRARAREVRQALAILGLDLERMTAVGVGGARPAVPHSNRAEIWKNRRVVFILDRNGE